MTSEQSTPIDRLSGIPLPLSPAYMQARPSRFAPDDHHPWHDRMDPLLHDSLGGNALRHSRVQKANYDAHHLDYHRAFEGPELPTDDAGRLQPIIFAAADYLPDQALAFDNRGKLLVVPFTEKERAWVRSRGLIRVENRAVVRNYLAQLTFQQDYSSFKPSTLDEFLNTSDSQRRLELGNALLTQAARQATEPVKQIYQKAYKANLIPEDRAHHVAGLVVSTLGMRRRREWLFKRLEDRIVTSAA